MYIISDSAIPPLEIYSKDMITDACKDLYSSIATLSLLIITKMEISIMSYNKYDKFMSQNTMQSLKIMLYKSI